MKMLNRIGFTKVIIICSLFVFVFSGCAGKKGISIPKEEFKLSERKRVEYQYLFLEANRSKLIGDFSRAIYFFNNCIEINPYSDAAHFELSNLYFAAGDIEKSINSAQNALKLDAENKWYYFQLARLHHSDGKIEKAADVYIELVKKFATELEYQMTLAGLFSESNRNEEALAVLEKVENITGLSDQVSLSRHNIFLKRGDFEKAFQELNKLIKHYPLEVRYHGMLAELYSNLGMDKQAIETYKKIFEIEADNGFAHLSLGEFYRTRGLLEESFPHFAIAFRDERVGLDEKSEVIASFISDTSELNINKVAIGQLVELLLATHRNAPQGRHISSYFFIQTQNYDRAIVEMKELIKLVPDNADVLVQFLLLLSYQGRYDELLEYGKVGYEKFPEKAIIFYHYGIAFYQKKQYHEAVEVLSKGKEVSGSDKELNINIILLLADTHHNLGNHKNSDNLFMEVINKDPENVLALNNYAYYLSLREEQLELAEKMSRITIDKEPESSTYLDTYAWILFKMKRLEEALIFIEKAISFNGSENAEILEHYGDILFENGFVEKAIVHWKEAYKIDNDRTNLLKKIGENE